MLDSVQMKAKNKLGLTFNQVAAYKIIYNFVSRFSFVQALSNNIYSKDATLSEIKLQDGTKLNEIPRSTKALLMEIGTDRVHIFFSPYAYAYEFEKFCERLRQQRAQMTDYVCRGLICIHKTKVFEVEYEGYEVSK